MEEVRAKSTPNEKEKLLDLAKDYVGEMDISALTQNDFEVEFKRIRLELLGGFLILSSTLKTDDSIKSYLILVLKSLQQLAADMQSITKENCK